MPVRNLGKNLNKTTKLSPAEQRVISSAERGEFRNFGEGDPSQGANWGEERTVSADVIYALCCGKGEEWPVHAKGVRIRGARIVGTLDFEAAILRCPLHLVSCFIEQRMCFDDARLPSLVLSGSFTQGLQADGMVCEGSVSLREGFSAKGEVRLRDAMIGGSLLCQGGNFKNSRGYALGADRLNCKGSVFLSESFSAEGEVRLLGATIGNNLDCHGGSFENPEGDALSLYNANVTGTLRWSGLQSPPKGRVRLTAAQVGSLVDEPESWPEKWSLLLNGFRYARIQPMDAKMRTQWLSRAPYGAQPYEQLATVLRSHGRQEDAKKILIAKQRARVRHGSDPRFVKLWIKFLGFTIGYGFRPGRAVWGLLLLWLFGFGVFSYAERHAMMAPSDVGVMSTASWTENRKVPPEYAAYPPFSAFAYSLDTMLPIVNFNMESYWEPSRSQEKSGTREWAIFVWWYLRLHIALGWILTTLAVLGFAGLVRQD